MVIINMKLFFSKLKNNCLIFYDEVKDYFNFLSYLLK